MHNTKVSILPTEIRVLMILVCILTLPLGLAEASRLRSKPAGGFSFDFSRWPYPLHAEVNARLQELTRIYPKLARTEIIGKSEKGRDLMVIEITNSDTGPGESKPGMWLDGNMHMNEETGRLYLSYFIERILHDYGKNPDATRLLDTRTFYVLPVFDADSGDRTLSRHPAWPGHNPEEHPGGDLDGDGYITRMRVKDDSSERGYQYYVEGPRAIRPDSALVSERRERNELTGEREHSDFNRNWSAEWEAGEGGSGPYPFSLQEVRAVADFITSHRNIFFAYNIHSGGGARSYMVRPPMNHPDDFMPLEDNDLYVRIGAIWSALSEGGIMQTNYMSWNFNSRRPDASELRGEGRIENDRWRITGFSNDWCYMHVGIHSISPEVEGAAPDYNEDGFIRPDEVDRWHREEKGNQFTAPWKQFDHPILGEVEIGGSRGMPAALDDTARMHSEWQYDLLRHIADRSPLLRIIDLVAVPLPGGKYRIVATLQNQGFLATYVTRNALKIRRDYPINARIQVDGGTVIEGEEIVNAGHLPGKLTVISDWSHGQDLPTKEIEWTVEASGSGPLEVSVEAWAHKAGRDRKVIEIE